MHTDPKTIAAIRGNPDREDGLTAHQASLVLRRLASAGLVIVDRNDTATQVVADGTALALAYAVWQDYLDRDDAGDPADLAKYDEGRADFALQALDLLRLLTDTPPLPPVPVLRYTNLDEGPAVTAMAVALGFAADEDDAEALGGVAEVITALNDAGVVLCAEVLADGHHERPAAGLMAAAETLAEYVREETEGTRPETLAEYKAAATVVETLAASDGS